MSKIEDLIRQYCPDGVEYKTLKDVCSDIIVPMRDRPKVFDGDVPWCRIEDKEGHLFNGSLSGLGVSDVVIKQMNLKVFPIGTVICSCSASLGAYAINTKPIITNQTFIGLVCGETILNWYLLYFMETQTKHLISLASTGTIPYISRKKFEDLEIPLPPLPVQEAIVNILDRFAVYAAELQTELQAELQSRQQQYNYYRDTLLSFEDRTDVKEFSVGEIATFTYGYTTKANDEGDIRYIRITDINEQGCLNSSDGKFIYQSPEVEPYLLRKGDLVMARTGATYGKTLYYNEEYPSAYASFLIKISFNDLVNPRYYWHFSKSIKYWEQARRLVGGGAQPQFNTGAISQVKITLPSLAEQQQIVDILDRFDTLTNDLSQGLPAEIEARRQQYEYYRDKLLTFKRK